MKLTKNRDLFGQECDQIGRILKVLVGKFAYKSSTKRLVTFGLFTNRSIYVCKRCFGYYLGNFWKHLGNFFTPTPGHTACEAIRSRLWKLDCWSNKTIFCQDDNKTIWVKNYWFFTLWTKIQCRTLEGLKLDIKMTLVGRTQVRQRFSFCS